MRQLRPVDAEGFIGIRSLRYLAHLCDVVVLSQRVPNFVESGLGTGAKRHVFRCTTETRDYGPCQSRVTFSVQPFVVLKFSSQDRILQCTVEQISRDADRRTVGRSADERVPRQNPAADSRHPSSAGSGGTRGGLHSFLQGQGSTAFCGADLPISRYFTRCQEGHFRALLLDDCVDRRAVLVFRRFWLFPGVLTSCSQSGGDMQLPSVLLVFTLMTITSSISASQILSNIGWSFRRSSGLGIRSCLLVCCSRTHAHINSAFRSMWLLCLSCNREFGFSTARLRVLYTS